MTETIKPARNISVPIQNLLWGRAAGRCQFAGCNKPLWLHHVTQETTNLAQKAHIWSFSNKGPRGNKGIEHEQINSFENLMLICHGCHTLIDDAIKEKKYTVEQLKQMKLQHEEMVERVTAISLNRSSHILLYGANIGKHNTALNFNSAVRAVFPEHFPAESTPREIGFGKSDIHDDQSAYWMMEKTALENGFDSNLARDLKSGEIQHLSVFALAPQPLLIRLGTLLTDISEVQTYQRHREPQTWIWQEDEVENTFQVIKPKEIKQKLALNISVSASICNSRITKILGEDTSIWTITIPNPHNDIIRSKNQLTAFRKTFRPLLDKIKKSAGHDKELHIFTAVPVSIAIEIGRAYMPKADMQLCLYDENKSLGGFVKAFNIPER